MITGKTRLMIEDAVRSVVKKSPHRVWTDPLCRNNKVIGRSIKYSGIVATPAQQTAILKKLNAAHKNFTFEVYATGKVPSHKGRNYRGTRVLVRRKK